MKNLNILNNIYLKYHIIYLSEIFKSFFHYDQIFDIHYTSRNLLIHHSLF